MCGLGALVGETLDLKRALARYREQRGAHGRFAMIWSFTPLMLMLYVVTTPVRVVVAATLGGFFFPEGGSSVVAAFLLGLAVPRLLGWINAGGVPPVGPAGLLETPSIDVEIDNLRSRTSAGDLAARAELARVLSRRRSLDDLDDLRTLADAGEGQAAFALAELLGRRGSHEDREELRVRSEAGSRAAARQFAIVLATRGNRKDFEDLRNRANEGDGESAYQVGLILGRSKDADDLSDAIRLARVAATAEVSGSSVLLNRLLKSRTSVDDVQELRERAGNGDGEAAYILANILKDRGGGRDLDEAVLLMRSSADSGRRGDAASRLLAELLLRRRSPADVDELRARAYAGVLSDDFLISDKAREYRLLIAEADGLTGRSGTSAP
jgi:TPR repeat protein